MERKPKQCFTNATLHHVSSTASTYNTSIDSGYLGASKASLRVRNDAGTYMIQMDAF